VRAAAGRRRDEGRHKRVKSESVCVKELSVRLLLLLLLLLLVVLLRRRHCKHQIRGGAASGRVQEKAALRVWRRTHRRHAPGGAHVFAGIFGRRAAGGACAARTLLLT
jgi:hypothetical protein